MPRLPRATCPDCQRDVAMRVGGFIREHKVRNRVSGLLETCPGSGKHLAEWGGKDGAAT